MLKVLLARFQQGHRTAQYPNVPPTLPDRLRGAPKIDASKCDEGCRECADACPTDAIRITQFTTDGAGSERSEREGRQPPRRSPERSEGAEDSSGGIGGARAPLIEIDTGKCLFCVDCTNACPKHAIEFTDEYRLAAKNRDDLIVTADFAPKAKVLGDAMKRLFGRSLKLRQVSAGGCNGCEADVNVLGTIVFDLGRFGIQMVASPRHADGILVTGPVSRNMHLALKKTWDAVPSPKIVIAVGACAISGGPYIEHDEVHGGADQAVPVDLYVPGCPPHPYTILDGLLGLLGRIDVPDANWRSR